jgi:signal transduction histidine kinase
MEWVVENLLKNALDAVDQEKGQIQVEVRREPQTESVDVRISDNGRGMTPREQHDVFTPGYSTKRRGWGLGLSLSRRIVEEYHGGRLFLAHSAPGGGSTFVIRFPL